MTDTAIAEADNLPARVEHTGSYLPAPAEWRTITQMADTLSRSGLVPTAYRGRPENVILATLAGRPFGWDPTMSMRSFHIIEGQPSMKPEIMLALIRRAGHSVTGKVTRAGATVTGTRCDNGDTMTAEFTLEDAERAEIGHKKVWKQFPSDMCWARALSAVGRRLFPDVLLGVGYTPEELGAADNDEVIEVAHVDDDPDRHRAAALKARARALPDDLRDVYADWFESGSMSYRNVVHLAAIQAKLNELEGIATHDDVVDAEIVEEPAPPAEVIDVKVPSGPVADDLELMTHAQKKKLFVLLNGQGIVGDEDRHDYASATLGRDITSFTELTRADAKTLVDALEKLAADQPAEADQ